MHSLSYQWTVMFLCLATFCHFAYYFDPNKIRKVLFFKSLIRSDPSQQILPREVVLDKHIRKNFPVIWCCMATDYGEEEKADRWVKQYLGLYKFNGMPNQAFFFDKGSSFWMGTICWWKGFSGTPPAVRQQRKTGLISNLFGGTDVWFQKKKIGLLAMRTHRKARVTGWPLCEKGLTRWSDPARHFLCSYRLQPRDIRKSAFIAKWCIYMTVTNLPGISILSVSW